MTEQFRAEPVADQVVRGGVQRAAGFVATNLLTAIGAVALLRHLGVEDFGRYGTVIALLSIVQGVSDAGLTMTATRELSLRESDRRRELLAHVLGLRMALTGVAVLAAVGFAALAEYDRDMVLGTLVAGGGVFLMSVQSAMLLPLMVELRNGRVAISETLRQGLLTTAFLVLALAGAALLSFFVAQLVAGVVLLALTPLLLAREHMVRPRWGLQELRALTAVGLPVAVATVLGVLYLRLLVVLMSLVSGSEREIGYYVTSTRIVELFVGLPFLLITVSLPVMTVAARDNEGRVNYVTARTTEIMAIGGVLIALVLAIAADPLVHLLGGDQYGPAGDVLRIQALVLPFVFLAAAWTPTLLGMGRAGVLVAASSLGALMLLGTGLLLIPELEAEGAALAAVAGDVTVCVVTYVLLVRVGPGRSISLMGLGRIALAAIPAVTIGLVDVVPDAVGAALAATVFVAAAVALRAVPPEILAAARGLAARGRRR